MVTGEAIICNKLGLHARAASKFASTASGFVSALQVSCNDKTIDGKSIMSLMLLAASKGTPVAICADGPDESEALAALIELIERRFDEAE